MIRVRPFLAARVLTSLCGSLLVAPAPVQASPLDLVKPAAQAILSGGEILRPIKIVLEKILKDPATVPTITVFTGLGLWKAGTDDADTLQND